MYIGMFSWYVCDMKMDVVCVMKYSDNNSSINRYEFIFLI